jgi:Fic family protein
VRESAVREIHPVIVAGVVHQELAAIHPFNDGNGRTARALATYVLYDRGYDFRRLFALEDFYNEDRPSYYAAIAIGKNYKARRTDFTPWLEYFIAGFKHEIDRVKREVTMLSSKKLGAKVVSQVFLEKEQMTIIDFLDSVGRITAKDVCDILGCPKRTAQLYLLRMKKLKMIRQVGKGPSAAYVLA